MADWRDGIPNMGAPKGNADPSAKAKATKKPVASSAGGWRGKADKPKESRSASERSWTGVGQGDVPHAGKLAKSFRVGTLGLSILALTIGFIIWVFSSDPRMPLFAHVSVFLDAYDVGINPYGQETVPKLIALSETQNITTVNLLKDPSAIGHESDRLLDDIAKSENWLEAYRKDYKSVLNWRWLRKDGLKGGGPGGNVTAYFISCYIVRENPNESKTGDHEDQWMLVTRSANPYEQGNLISIKQCLERIAAQTSAGKYAWIAFDVKSPSVVTNVADLEFPAEAFKAAFRELRVEHQGRLIITLPCSQSEESWIAPEFSNSVFAHFFLEGLSTGFSTSKSQAITVKKFEEGLKDKVGNWVKAHRHAQQTPFFLMSEGKANLQLFGVAENPVPPANVAAIQSDWTEKFRDLDGNWSRFSKLKSCAWLDPMRYAKVESQLIQMEEIAETNATFQWRKFQNAVSEDLTNLEESCKFERVVSLVETKLHCEVFPSKVISEPVLMESRSRDVAWFNSPPWLSEKPKVSSARDERTRLSRNDRCFQVWTVVEKIAKSEAATEWDRTFNSVSLQACLDYIGPVDPDQKMEWLEIQLLRILLEEIDWDFRSKEVTEAEISKSCAQAIRIFSEIQSIAVDANPELSRCLGKEVLKLDSEFLKGFDLLVTNEFKSSLNTLKRIENEVLQLKQDKDHLVKAMYVRDRAFHFVPHALTFWMRSFRYSDVADERDDAVKQVEVLGEVIRRAVQIKDELGKPQGLVRTSIDKVELSEIETLLVEAEKKIEAIFNSLTSAEAKDQQAIRGFRIALRSPFLSDKLRIQFHDNLGRFYSQNNVDSSANVDGVMNSKRSEDQANAKKLSESQLELLRAFLNKIGKIDERVLYDRLSYSDPRFYGGELVTKPSEQVGFESKYQALYSANFKSRMRANAFGQRAFAKQWELEKWPWNAPAQFRELNTADYCSLQARRLFEARWGDGELDEARMNIKQLYFQRLANPYLEKLRDHRSEYDLAIEIKHWGEDLATQDVSAFDNIAHLELAVAPVNASTKIDSNANEQGKADVRFEVSGSTWQVTAAVYLGNRGDGIRRKLKGADTAAYSLSGMSSNRSISMNGKDIEQRKLYLAIRGHYLSRTLQRQLPGGQYQLELDRDRLTPNVRVDAKNDNPTNILILLDCSDSMGKKFVEAKNCVIELLNQLSELHEAGEATFKIGVFVFGYVPNSNMDMDKEWSESKHGNQIFQIQPKIADRDFIELLRKRIGSKNIYSAGCTPLYDAIYAAVEIADGNQTRMVVVSDGFDDITKTLSDGSPFYKGDECSFERLQDFLRRSKGISLSIYQCKTDEFYKMQKENIAAFDKVMNNLKTICKDLYFFESFSGLSQSLLASFPKSFVELIGSTGKVIKGRFSEEIEIPTSELPFKGIVRVHSFDYQGSRQPPADRPIEIIGNENLQLVYQASSNQLNFISFSEFAKSNSNREESKVPLVETSGLKRDYKIVGSLRKIEKPSHEIAIQIEFQGFQGKDAKYERENLVPRPKFIVAKVAPSSDSVGRSLMLADYKFRPSHYPAFEFNRIPWERDGDWQSKGVDLDIWYSAEIPSFATKVELMQEGGVQTLEDGKIKCQYLKNAVFVEIESSERYFVVCNQSERNIRIYEEAATEKNRDAIPIREVHELLFAPNHLGNAEIFVVRLSDLKDLNTNNLTHVRCQWNDR